MFTGIIESIGELQAIRTENDNTYLQVRSNLASELKIDQSLAHDGVCLTITAIEGDIHTVCAIPETLKKTSIGQWAVGKPINLERCVLMNGRLDGHIVQGHVDTQATCIERHNENESWRFVFQFDTPFAHLVIEKGSICVNGVSLTCYNVGPNSFEVSIIPYTYHHTNFNALQLGMSVNLEFDLLGKYLARFRELGQ